jgi:hypothetical protein
VADYMLQVPLQNKNARVLVPEEKTITKQKYRGFPFKISLIYDTFYFLFIIILNSEKLKIKLTRYIINLSMA